MSWAKKSYTFSKNCRWSSSVTTKYYIPLTGNQGESANADEAVCQFLPSNSGRLLNISFSGGVAGGSTIVTLEDATAGTLATKTFTWSGNDTINVVDFTSGLDSGTNKFNGLSRIRIGVDVSVGVSSGEAVTTFEIDL